MPTITVDGQSLAIDGRRLWIVSGTVCYHRVPAALWAPRIAAAKQAGLNCIEAPVVWSLHEPRAGIFKFDGDLDLVAFIRLIGAAKMHCILRIGPYVGDGIDLGGMPAWLLKECRGRLRSGASEFLQPVSRYFSAVCDRVQGLQASLSRKAAGPIIAVQNEHQWLCGSASQAAAYLGETNRYLRENGMNVPILSANGLFASAEGEIEVWSGSAHLHANMRQLRALKSDQPRVVMGLPTGERGVWGRGASLSRLEDSPPPPKGRGSLLMRAMCEVLAAGAQFNLSPFHGGTNFGFLGGRFGDGEGSFATTSAAAGSPLGEAGERGETYTAMRRVCTFASQFGRVLSGLDPAYQPAIVSLDAHPSGAGKKGKATTDDCSLVAVECRGSQGGVVFVFGPAGGEMVRRRASIVLADGSTLPMELEREPVGWMLLDTHLVDRATLDYCNLSAFALVGRVFVCYGPAGMFGVMSINGSAFEVSVPPPGRAEPHVSEHEGVTVVVCNEDSIDAVWVDGSAVYAGASGFDAAGHPLGHPSYKKVMRIAGTGEVSFVAAAAVVRKKPKVALGAWGVCGTDDLVKGKSERYASIEGPAGLEALGAASGYGWVRLKFKHAAKSVKGGFFEAADRLHLYFDGEYHALIGAGPGADDPVVALPFKKGEHVVTALIDNLGRRCEGDAIGERKGLFGHVQEAAVFRAGSPKIVGAKAIEPLSHWPVVMGLEDGDATDPRRVTWRIQHRKKTPLIMRVGGLSDPTVLMLDGKALRVLPRGATEYVVLTPEMLSRGTNEVQVAVVGDVEAALRSLKESVVFYEGVSSVTAKAGWSFAKWEPPGVTKFKALAGRGASEFKSRPAWWRATFTADSVGEPLYFEATGLSKGQLFVNGHNAGRYFVATRTGKNVPGQSRYYLPEPWLKVGANEIVLFDEHGNSPERCRVGS